MFSARLGTRLARLGNLVLGYVELPQVAVVLGQRSALNRNTQQQTRLPQSETIRMQALQMVDRMQRQATRRMVNKQTSPRR